MILMIHDFCHSLCLRVFCCYLVCAVLSLSKWYSYYRLAVLLMVGLPWIILKPKTPSLQSLRIPKTDFPLFLPAHRQSDRWNCLKRSWAQWFQKHLLLSIKYDKTHESEQVLRLHLAWKVCLGIENVLVFYHQNPQSLLLRKGLCVW